MFEFAEFKAGRVRSIRAGFAVAALMLLVVVGRAQDPLTTNTSDAPFDAAAIVGEADSAEQELQDIEAKVAPSPRLAEIAGALPEAVDQIDARLAEADEQFSADPTLAAIRDVESTWNLLAAQLAGWQAEVTSRAGELFELLDRLDRLNEKWSGILDASDRSSVPGEVAARAGAIIDRTSEARRRAEESRLRALTLQNRIGEQESRVRDALRKAQGVRELAVGRLLERDRSTLWTELRATRAINLASQSRAALETEHLELGVYFRRYADRFALHLLLVIVATSGVAWVRRRARPWVARDESLGPAASVFDHPIACAVVVSALAGEWVYPEMPRTLGAVFGAAAVASTAVILWRLVDVNLRALLPALTGLYIGDLAGTLLSTVPVASRLEMLAQSMAAVLFLIWFVRHQTVGSWLRRGAFIALAAFGFAVAACVLGYVALSEFLVTACLGSAYTAVVLFATAKIADGLTMFALRSRPLGVLRFVRRHRPVLQIRAQIAIRAVLFFVWLTVTLELLAARREVISASSFVLSAGVSVGAYRATIGDALLFLACIIAAVMLSRFVLFVLEEDVYPRADLPRGVPYAVSTIARYVLILCGIAFAIGALGVDVSKFALLAGAFGVGLGLGLQNVVANFASGLVLLFERPVKVGDTLEVQSHFGELRRVGLRASVLRTQDGSEVIVPNADLISEKVINWTFSDQQRRLAIDVGVAYGTDPERVVALLTEVASSHPNVLEHPSPQAMFLGFGDSALNFQLRAWTDSFDKWQLIRSQLAIGIYATLREARIQIPFPQRDVNVRPVSPDQILAPDGDTTPASQNLILPGAKALS